MRSFEWERQSTSKYVWYNPIIKQSIKYIYICICVHIYVIIWSWRKYVGLIIPRRNICGVGVTGRAKQNNEDSNTALKLI